MKVPIKITVKHHLKRTREGNIYIPILFFAMGKKTFMIDILGISIAFTIISNGSKSSK